MSAAAGTAGTATARTTVPFSMIGCANLHRTYPVAGALRQIESAESESLASEFDADAVAVGPSKRRRRLNFLAGGRRT